jgi:general stress protein 26
MTNDTEQHTTSDTEAAQTLHELIMGIRIAMLTTEGSDGELYSRPMYVQQVEAGGDLWFATSQSSSLALQVRDEGRVLATFSGSNGYVVVRGMGRITRDREKVRELWNPAMKAWFPDGPDDPDIALIRVEAERADYWDTPSAPVRWLQLVKSLATGTQPELGDRVALDLTSDQPQQTR